MRFQHVVETSRRISETSKRLEKIALLASLLKELQGDEIDIAAAFLSGRTRQGKIGAGYGVVGQAAAEAAGQSDLELTDVDRVFQSIADTQGAGSERRRIELLRDLLVRGTRPEQE